MITNDNKGAVLRKHILEGEREIERQTVTKEATKGGFTWWLTIREIYGHGTVSQMMTS